MKFSLSPEQQLLQQSMREFVQAEIAPYAAGWDQRHEFPTSAIQKCAELGLMGIFAPKEYGGSDMSALDYVIALEEISRGCASVGVILSVHNSLVIGSLNKLGNEAQKKKYLPRLASGEWLGCFSLTEPGAGSDAGSQTTLYEDCGDHFVLRGSKNFVTNGPQANLALVFATRDRTEGKKGVSAFLVETATPGFRVVNVERKMGICASGTATLAFDDVKVPKHNLLGSEGEGFKVAMQTLDSGRIGIAAQSLGIAQAAFEAARRYSRERTQFGQPIGEFQGIRWMLADMAVAIDAARLLTFKAAVIKDRGERCSLESAQAKLIASETANRVARKAVQIHGGYGYIKEYPVERHMRDARVTEIYEGTSEIQRLVIAAQMLRNDAVVTNL